MLRLKESERIYSGWFFATIEGILILSSFDSYIFKIPANVVSVSISNVLDEPLRISRGICHIPRTENTDFQRVTFIYSDGSTETHPFYIEKDVSIPLADTSLVIRNLLDNYFHTDKIESNLNSVQDWLQNNDFRCIYEIHILYYALVNCAGYYRHNPLIKNLLSNMAKLVVSKIETDIKHKYYVNELTKLFQS